MMMRRRTKGDAIHIKTTNQAFNRLNKNISTTVHAMTKSLVPFYSAQNGESNDINCFSVLSTLQKSLNLAKTSSL